METFGIVALLLPLVVIVAGITWLGHRFVQFKTTPEAVWRDRILGFAVALEDKLDSLRKELNDAKTRRGNEVAKERVKAFQRYLASISVDELQDYPGIGPVTVDRLRQAGMANLLASPPDLQLVEGIGPKKEQVVKDAIEQALRNALSRFDAGGCREAQQCAERTRLIDKALAQQIADAEEMSRFCEHSMLHLGPYLAIARRITFFGCLRQRRIAELTPELLNQPVERLVPPLSATTRKPLPTPATPTPATPPIVSGVKAARTNSSAPAVINPQSIKTPPAPADLFRAELETVPQTPVAQSAEHPRLGHLRAAAQFGLAVARADGKVAGAERGVIRRHLQLVFGHESELVRWINPLMEAAEKKAATLEQSLAEMFDLFDDRERRELYRLAGDIVDATGKRNAKKKACLERIAAAWDIGAAPVVAAVPVPQAPIASSPKPEGTSRDECLQALDIAASTPISADLVRRQYRLLSERIDPTKLESHGADFVKLAHDKRGKIELAARLLLEQLGEKFEEEKKPEEPKDLRHNPDLDSVFGM